jgi:hypothetical protein
MGRLLTTGKIQLIEMGKWPCTVLLCFDNTAEICGLVQVNTYVLAYPAQKMGG